MTTGFYYLLLFPRFESHVHHHFAQEDKDEEEGPVDPSGPWGGFQLLEID